MKRKERFFKDSLELLKLYDKLNFEYFKCKLPTYGIVWYHRYRTTHAEVYVTGIGKVIKLNFKYHYEKRYWYAEIVDTLKHEMIHIWQYHIVNHGHWNTWKCGHNNVFKIKAKEIGCKYDGDIIKYR